MGWPMVVTHLLLTLVLFYVYNFILPCLNRILQILPIMAFSFSWRHWCSAVALISISVSLCYADQQGDPVQIVAKALLCFNDHTIYKNCEEQYRLTLSGNLPVPPEATDVFCNGPCYAETELVLNCVNDILNHFLFFNKATVEDIRTTIHAGCSDTSKRGNFDVASHLEGEYSAAHKLFIPLLMYMAMVIGSVLLL